MESNSYNYVWGVDMTVCFFNDDYDHKYSCEYEIVDQRFCVTVDYDIDDEIEAENDIKSFGPSTEYKSRDILIVDQSAKTNFLLKDAYYAGSTSVFGSPDSGTKTRFKAIIFFKYRDPNALAELPITPKVRTIRVYSKSLYNYVNNRSVRFDYSDEETTIHLMKNTEKEIVNLKGVNIKEVSLYDLWSSSVQSKDQKIVIDKTGCIELDLNRRVDYDVLYPYLNELMLFLELYEKGKNKIDKIDVTVNDKVFEISMPLREPKLMKGVTNRSVEDDLLTFLEKCYSRIPYRGKRNDIRNIFQIIFNNSINIEDVFLAYYRFIECYYKRKNTPGARTTFMTQAFDDHYNENAKKSFNKENTIQEIISLRNHYVHSGYHLRNASLRVKFDDTKRNYTVNNIDVDWIYDRTQMLRKISIDIIFKDLLGYQEYKFE